jgi:hypothetical protein
MADDFDFTDIGLDEANEVVRAINSFNDRKHAAGVDKAQLSGEEITRRVMSGFDIPYEVIGPLKKYAVTCFFTGIRSGHPPAEVIAGIWCDALFIGLYLAQQRERERAKKNEGAKKDRED